MKKKILSVVLLLSMLLSMPIFSREPYGLIASEKYDGTVSADFYMPVYDWNDEDYLPPRNEDGAAETYAPYAYPIRFDGDYFSISADTYDNQTAMFALAMAISSFNDDEDETEAERIENIVKFYEAFGFYDAEYYHYDRNLNFSGNSSAYSIASRPITTDGVSTTLVAVTCRGGGYSAEWASNVCVAPLIDGFTAFDGTHKGFGESAAEVYASVTDYIDRVCGSQSQNIKIILTGFSRGASIANLTAASLCEDSRYISDNIFAYCFAPPANTVAKLGYVNNTELYPRIYNIINPADIVPYVVSDSYGFKRYGRDVFMPSYFSYKDYDGYQSDLQLILVHSYNKTLLRRLYDMPEVERAKDLFIDSFILKIIPTIFDFYRPRLIGSSVQELAMSILAKAFGDGGTGTLPNLSEIIPSSVLELLASYLSGEDGELVMRYMGASHTDEGWIYNDIFPYVRVNHLPETYLAMLYVSEKRGDDISTLRAGKTRVQVGSLKDGSSVALDCESYLGQPCEFWIENGTPFSLDIETEYEYTLFNEKRDLFVRIERYDDSGAIESVQSYSNLPFFETSIADIEYCSSYTLTGADDFSLVNGWGIKLRSEVELASFGSAFRAVTNDTSLGCVTTDGCYFDMNLIDYDRYYFDEYDYPYRTGDVYGLIWNEAYVRPTVRLNATAYEGATFVGWYEDGQLIGSESELELRVGKERYITAVFEPAN